MVLAAVQLLGSGPLMPTSEATKHLKEGDEHSTGSPPHTPGMQKNTLNLSSDYSSSWKSDLPIINHVLPLDLQTGTAAIY